MYCNKCGNYIDETKSVKFCNKCGNDVSEVLKKVVDNKKEELGVEKLEENENVVSPKEEVTPKPDKKKSYVWLIVILSIVAILLVVLVIIELNYGVELLDSSKDSTNTEQNVESSQSTKKQENISTSSNEAVEKLKSEGQRIGSKEYGFISVPKDWVKFIDVDGNSTIQYSYGITWISTIFSLDANITDAQNYATVVYSKLSDDGVSDLKAETEKVNGYKAYKVYGYYTDEGKWLVCWFIDGKNDKTYYIAVEGPDLDNDYFKNIIQTFDENE